MLVRLFLGVGLFALGYYLGKEVGRAEPIREELRMAREGARQGLDDAADESPPGVHESGTADRSG